MFTLTIENKDSSFVRVIDIDSNRKADARWHRRKWKKVYPYKSYTFKMHEWKPLLRFLPRIQNIPTKVPDPLRFHIPQFNNEPPACCQEFGPPTPSKVNR